MSPIEKRPLYRMKRNVEKCHSWSVAKQINAHTLKIEENTNEICVFLHDSCLQTQIYREMVWIKPSGNLYYIRNSWFTFTFTSTSDSFSLYSLYSETCSFKKIQTILSLSRGKQKKCEKKYIDCNKTEENGKNW